MKNLPPPAEFSAREVSNFPILRYFHYSHLPAELQQRSKPFCALARDLVDTTEANAERAVALRKLLESKDAAVRAGASQPTTVLPHIATHSEAQRPKMEPWTETNAIRAREARCDTCGKRVLNWSDTTKMRATRKRKGEPEGATDSVLRLFVYFIVGAAAVACIAAVLAAAATHAGQHDAADFVQEAPRAHNPEVGP